MSEIRTHNFSGDRLEKKYVILFSNFSLSEEYLIIIRGRHGRDRMVVRFTTTYAIKAYHH
jgi:hypothetical protein